MTKTLAQKAVAIATALTLSGMMALPAYGQTVEELQAQIQALLAQIATLQSQLAALQGSPAGGYTCTFTRPLGPGDSGDDVKCLQQSMNALGFQVAASGPGSPGNETTFYGPLTQAAVKKWQDAVGVVYGAWGGYFGPISQAKYNSLKSAPAEEEEEAPAEEEEEAPVVGECKFSTTAESILSVEYAPSPANNPVIKEGEEKPAFGVRVKVRQGDACFERLQFRLGTSTSRYTRQFTEAALFDTDGTTELARKVLNSNTVIKSGSNYLVTLDGFKKLLAAGGDYDFVVKLKAYSQIDSTYTDTDPADLRVEANGVRAVDAQGINQYAPSSDALDTRSVDLQQGEAEQAELTISRNADYPRNYRVVSDTQGEADNVLMNILDVKAKKGRVKITDFSASLTEDPDGAASPSTAYLYRKDGTTWKLIASASISSNAWTWSDITDEWVEKDTTNTYKIEVKFTGASSSEGVWIVNNLDAGDVTAENELGDSVTPSEGVASSSEVRVANKGPVYEFVSSSIKYTKAGVSGASGTLEGSFTFKVTAKGADIFASKTASGAFTVTVIDDDGNSTTSAVLGTITYNQPSGTVSETNSYRIPQDSTVTVTVNYAALSGAIDAQAGFDLGEQYKLRLTEIKWGTSDSAPTANPDSYMDTATWETGYVLVAD